MRPASQQAPQERHDVAGTVVSGHADTSPTNFMNSQKHPRIGVPHLSASMRCKHSSQLQIRVKYLIAAVFLSYIRKPEDGGAVSGTGA